MAKENITPLSQGKGSVSPDFAAPTAGVATPGRQLQPQQTNQEKFRDTLIAFGQGIAGAATARATINSKLKDIKDQSMAKVEADLDRSVRSFQAKRLEAADRNRQQILVDASEKGMEWAEREFRLRMVNASSTQEARLWESAWQGASSMVSRENGEARRQAFNSAKMTMVEVGLSLSAELSEDVALRSALIGDGSSIGTRVQDWMLSEIQQATDLDNLSTEDAELLIHQSIVQSAGIADNLRGQYQKQVEDSNLSIGTRQLSSDVFSTISGEQDSVHLREQIEVTLRDRMSHLSIDQQAAFVRDQVVSALQNTANGSLGINAADAITNTTALLNLTVNGERVFNDVERKALAAELQSSGLRTISREAEGSVSRLRESTRMTVQTEGGIIFPPNPNAEAALLIKDDSGRDAYDIEADRMLAEQGLLGLENPTPEQSLMIAAVRGVMNKQRSGQSAKMTAAQKANANFTSVFDGRSGDGNSANDINPLAKARRSSDELAGRGIPAMDTSDIAYVKNVLQNYAFSKEDQKALRAWSGETLDYTEENRNIQRMLAHAEADQWNKEGVQAETGIPSDLARDKLSLMTADNPLEVEAFSVWATKLKSGAGNGWDNFIAQLTPNEAAAAAWVRAQANLGQPLSKTGASTDPLDLMDQVRTIIAAPDIKTWFNKDTGTEEIDARFTNARNMAEILTAIIKEENPDTEFNEDASLLVQLEDMIVSGNSAIGRSIKKLWAAGSITNPNMDDSQIGSIIFHWLRADGFRFRTINGKIMLIQDSIGYTGEQGGDIKEFVGNHMLRGYTTEYRNFLQVAMGVDAKDVPLNLEHMLTQNSEGISQPESPFLPTGVVPNFNFLNLSSERMQESRAKYGGFIVQAQILDQSRTPTSVLPHIISKHDATLYWPDGSSTFVRKGTVLNIINPDLFVPTIQKALPFGEPVQPTGLPRIPDTSVNVSRPGQATRFE